MGFLDSVASVLPFDKGRNLQLYSNAYVIKSGSLLTQNASVTLEKKSGSEPIHTLGAGFAGVSLGSPLIEITIENAIPSADFEFNPDLVLKTGEPIEIGVVIAGRQCVFRGFVTDATYTHAVNDPSRLNFKMLCRYSVFE